MGILKANLKPMDSRCLNLDDDDATSVSGHYKLLDEMSQKMASR
jgi:hypothetical protein